MFQAYLAQDKPGALFDFAAEVLEELTERFQKYEDDPLYVAAAVWDPMCKLRWCRYASKKDKAADVRTVLLEMMHDLKLQEAVNGHPTKTRKVIQPKHLDFMSDDEDEQPVVSCN